MADAVSIRVNDVDFRAKLNTFGRRIQPTPLLKIIGAYMLGSVDRTFREQGSPADSWAPLKAWTKEGAQNRISKKRLKTAIGESEAFFVGHGKGALAPGKKILIQSGRLKKSIIYQVEGNTVRIGSNLVYAAIQDLGGLTGRGHKARIPARPYLVFRPEDPKNIVEALQTYIDNQAKSSGLK